MSTVFPLIKFYLMFRSGEVSITYNSDHIKLTNLERQEDENNFSKILIEVFPLSKLDDSPVLDELTNGFSATIYGNKLQLSRCYATQILLDIHKVLQKDVGRGLSDLQPSGTHVTSVLKNYNSTLPCACQQLLAFERINTFIDRWILGDALGRWICKGPGLDRVSSGT
jgi:hypothetical protein